MVTKKLNTSHSIVVGKSEQKYGGGKGPQNGSLICEIYTKSGQGQLRTAQIADAIDDLLRKHYVVDFRS